MKNLIFKTVCLLICLSVALFAFGACSTKDDDTVISSNTFSKTAENTSSEEQVVAEEPTEEASSSESSYTDENWQTDEWVEEEFDEYVEYFELDAAIDNTTALSERYMGSGTGVYFCYPYMKDNYGRNATDEQIEIEMNRLQDMNIHTVRSKFKFLWVRDESVPGGWNWESDNMKAVYRWLGEMKERDIDVMLNPWSFAWIYGGDTSIPDTEYFHTDDFTVNSTRWCNAVTELFKECYARGYTNAKYIVMFTEPIYRDEISEQTYSWYIENAKRLHTTLTKAGIREKVKVVGPNRSDDDTELVIRCFKEADEAFDIYTHHRYIQGPNLASDVYADDAKIKWGSYVNEMKDAGMGEKPYWVDEWGIQDDSQTARGYSNVGFDDPLRGVQQAVAVTTGMNLGIDNMLLWTLVNQQWPNQRGTGTSSGFYDGVLAHGLFNNIQKTLKPKAQYYSYSLLSKYTGRGGGKTFLAGPTEEFEYWGVYLGCTQTSDGDWTIIIVNTNAEYVDIDVDIAKSLGGAKLYRHQYVATEIEPNIAAQIIPANKTFLDVTTELSDILRPNSVAVYTTIKG